MFVYLSVCSSFKISLSAEPFSCCFTRKIPGWFIDGSSSGEMKKIIFELIKFRLTNPSQSLNSHSTSTTWLALNYPTLLNKIWLIAQALLGHAYNCPWCVYNTTKRFFYKNMITFFLSRIIPETVGYNVERVGTLQFLLKSTYISFEIFFDMTFPKNIMFLMK